jgi:hypothetical protein
MRNSRLLGNKMTDGDNDHAGYAARSKRCFGFPPNQHDRRYATHDQKDAVVKE